MTENNIAVQSAVAPASKKLMLNGVEATAQQVYDAFMAGPVRLDKNGTVRTPIKIYWENSDGTHTNPKAVTYVELSCIESSGDSFAWSVFYIGTKYSPPVG